MMVVSSNRAPRWSEAVEQARALLQRCRVVRDGPGHPVTPSDVDLWALVVYGVAVTERCGVAGVSPAQLRLRVEDQTRLTVWLWDALRRAGHSVPRPSPPPFRRGIAADFQAAAIRWGTARSAGHASADDPVVRHWTLSTALVSGSSEMNDGTVVDDPVTCTLWASRHSMVCDLDALLVHERGGWPAGTLVWFRGLPPAITSIGDLATELGLFPDRARVDAPAWRVDDAQSIIVDGPPSAYFLSFLEAETGQRAAQGIGPIHIRHLTTDYATEFGDDVSANVAANRASAVRAPGPAHLTPGTAPKTGNTTASATSTTDADIDTDTPGQRATERARAAGTDQDWAAGLAWPGDLTAPGADERNESLDRELRAYQLPARHRVSLPATMASCAEDPFRAAAIARLWTLRDTELAVAGDSIPQRVAERIAEGGYPAPPEDPNARTLIARELAAHHDRDHARRAARHGTGSIYRVDRQLITDAPRQVLLTWLRTMNTTTVRQRHALDLRVRPSLADVRDLLAREGFTEVLDVHHNAPTTTASITSAPVRTSEPGKRASDHEADQGDQRNERNGDQRNVDLVAVNAAMGWLAVLHVWRNPSGGLEPEHLTVYHNTLALDEELLATALSGGGWYFDENRERTRVCYGAVSLSLSSHYAMDGSFRVHLAALRAFGTPVIPWMVAPFVHIGSDGTPRAEQQRILARLPEHVRSLVGPLVS